MSTNDNEKTKSISLNDASKELGLEIELFSYGPGCAFSEHYYINNGEIVVDEECDFIEIYLPFVDENSDDFDEEAYNNLEEDTKSLVDNALENGVDDWLEGEDYLILCNFCGENDWKWEHI